MIIAGVGRQRESGSGRGLPCGSVLHQGRPADRGHTAAESLPRYRSVDGHDGRGVKTASEADAYAYTVVTWFHSKVRFMRLAPHPDVAFRTGIFQIAISQQRQSPCFRNVVLIPTPLSEASTSRRRHRHRSPDLSMSLQRLRDIMTKNAPMSDDCFPRHGWRLSAFAPLPVCPEMHELRRRRHTHRSPPTSSRFRIGVPRAFVSLS